VGELVRVWKAHREAIFTSTIIPIGDEPDGYAWTGFVTHRKAGDLYALVFRERAEREYFAFELPRSSAKAVEVLHGPSEAVLEGDNRVALTVKRPLEYAFIRVRF
jgi:alpha-galactosidase